MCAIRSVEPEPSDHNIYEYNTSPHTVVVLFAVVVNETHAAFYRNSKLLGVESLKRPVTDCADSALILGDATGVTIGELTYYPRALSTVEQNEIMTDGTTLQELVTGGPAPAVFVSDADFTTERLAVEAASLTRSVKLASEDSRTITTRSTLRVEKTMKGFASPTNASWASGSTAGGTSAGAFTCYAGKRCAVTVPMSGNSTANETSLQLSTSGCVETNVLGLKSCAKGATQNGTHVTFHLGTASADTQPTTYQLCMDTTSSTCAKVASLGSLDSLFLEADSWSYAIPLEGMTFEFERPAPFDFVDTRSSLSGDFTYASNVKVQPDNVMYLGVKHKKSVKNIMNDRIQWDDICWSFAYDGRRKKIHVNSPRYSRPYSSNWLPTSMDPKTVAAYNWTSEEGMFSCDVKNMPVDDGTWKHVALVSTDQKVEVFIAGKPVPGCSFTIAQLNNATIDDCEGGVIRIGGPGQMRQENYWSMGEMYGAKKWSRALSSYELERAARCVDPPTQDDQSYHDAIGNGCRWYAKFAKDTLAICTANTIEACPIACGTAPGLIM